MRKIFTIVAALTLALSISGCNNYMSGKDPIIGDWVDDATDNAGLRFVLGFQTDKVGEMWYEKDKKLNGKKSPFIYTRSQTELNLSSTPVGGGTATKSSYKINSLSGSTMSLTNNSTQAVQSFTKKP